MSQASADLLYVKKATDTMTGPLTLSGTYALSTGSYMPGLGYWLTSGAVTRAITLRDNADLGHSAGAGITVVQADGSISPINVGNPGMPYQAVNKGWLETNYLTTHAGRNNEANKQVRTNASGYIDVTYINTDANVATGNPTYVMAIHNNDGYMRRTAPGYLGVDYANRSGTDGGVWRMSTVVIAQTDANGQGSVDTGRAIGTVVLCNGDFPAHNRAVSVNTFGGNVFTFTNTDPNKALRINWMVS